MRRLHRFVVPVTPAGALAVAAGAVLGAWLRWVLGLAFNVTGAPLPLGTLAANLAGGLMAGMSMAWFSAHPDLAPEWRLFAVTGFLGALTTFSTFSAESLTLIERGELPAALAHSAVHLLGCLAAAALGFRMLR
ncbi:MAG: fluoride efflux transporter CrcB [Burkholderiales bacterium]|nr:fluoride efflux transporter CrcB [Burkholderiales bacterium]